MYNLDELRKKYNQDSLEVQIKDCEKHQKQIEDFLSSLKNFSEELPKNDTIKD